MKSSVTRRAFLSLLVVVCVQAAAAQAQTASQDDDEVIRVNAELVQTDVTVVDKRGRFVEDLKPEQFELKVDGRVVPLSFFERVRAGGADDEMKLNAARGVKTTADTHARSSLRQTPRAPFSGELSLEQLPPGRYVLQISAAARSKLAATQQANFILE